MLRHRDVTLFHIRRLIQREEIMLAGNLSLKIYGTLSCASGKRMKKENRVFFKNETEAIQQGFRPCCHCLHNEYVCWKVSRSVTDSTDHIK